MPEAEEGNPQYERLRDLITEVVESDEFGVSEGYTVGWVLLVAQSELKTRDDDLLLIGAPLQSEFMSRGIIDMARDYVANFHQQIREAAAAAQEDDDS